MQTIYLKVVAKSLMTLSLQNNLLICKIFHNQSKNKNKMFYSSHKINPKLH